MLNLNKVYLSLSIRAATASVINWSSHVLSFIIRFHVAFHKVTFSESVITLRTSRRSNQKNEGSRIHVPFGALEDLGKVIVGEEKTEGGQVCWLHRTQT